MTRTSRTPATLVVPVFALACCLASVPSRSEDNAATIIRLAFEAAKTNYAAARHYVYHERIEELRFDRKGKLKRRESHTWDVTLLEHSEHRVLIERDDAPLSSDEAAKQQRKLAKQIRKMQRETPRQKRKRLARIERSRQEGEAFLAEIPKAFEFRILREEAVDEVDTWVLSAEPRQGYVPSGREARVLTKVRATLWVSRDDYGWVQADIETLAPLTWALVLKLHEGARIRFRQRRHEDGTWLTERWNARFRAKVAQVVGYNRELTGTYANFRKFQTETTATGWSVESSSVER